MVKFLDEIRSLLHSEVSILETQKSKWFLVGFCALFSTFFLNVYDPLDISDYYINSSIGLLIPIGFAGIIGSVVLIFTQFYLRKKIGPEQLTLSSLLQWAFLELSLIAIVVFIFYGERGQPFIPELVLTYQKSILLAIVPYSIGLVILYLHGMNKNSATDFSTYDLLNIVDDKGKSKISIRQENLLYIKSEDNYVAIYFLQNGNEEKILLRNTLKKILAQIPSDHFVQIHRSYVINKSHISHVNRSGGKTEIILDNVNRGPFSISNTYKYSIE